MIKGRGEDWQRKKNGLRPNLDSLIFQRNRKEEGQTTQVTLVVELGLRTYSPWKDGCPGI